ncbi:MAG: class I SAM-dependent methyltransferase [Ruminococcus sp.]
MAAVYDQEEFFKRYADMDRSRRGLSGAGEWHQLKKMFPSLKGKRVLDLGCGYGWHCKYAVDAGARSVIGIDASRKMIEEAVKRNLTPEITYKVCSLEAFDYPENGFECVISNLVLHYIEDLDDIFRKVHRTLCREGIFLLNIEHPVFTSGINQEWIADAQGCLLYWPVDNYFYPGARRVRFLGQEMTKQHHTLTQILMGLLNAGFCLEAVEEAMPSPKMAEIPGMKDEMRRPMMLMIRGRKRDDRVV